MVSETTITAVVATEAAVVAVVTAEVTKAAVVTTGVTVGVRVGVTVVADTTWAAAAAVVATAGNAKNRSLQNAGGNCFL